MQLLISCAKTMAEAPAVTPPRTTRPRFAAEADRLASHLAALPADELGRLLRVNAGLAAENRRRYLRFHDAPAMRPSRPTRASSSGTSHRSVSRRRILNTPSSTSTSPRSSTGCCVR